MKLEGLQQESYLLRLFHLNGLRRPKGVKLSKVSYLKKKKKIKDMRKVKANLTTPQIHLGSPWGPVLAGWEWLMWFDDYGDMYHKTSEVYQTTDIFDLSGS